MGPRLRKMKPYYPRRKRSKNPEVLKQALSDLEHRMKSSVSSLLLFVEQGNTEQFNTEKLKLKSDLLKHADEMQRIATNLGHRYTTAVKNFLDSVDTIVHTEAQWIDENKIRYCYKVSQALEKEIRAA